MGNNLPAITKGALLRGFSVVSLGNILGELLRFIRNVIVARILTPADFGIAATFWITTGFLMSASELGVQQMLVRDKDGDDEHFGAVAQFVLLARGVILAVLIFIFAEPVALLFEIPETTWAFQLLAIMPLLSGLQHRDIIRRQRNLEFTPFVLSKLLPDVIITLLAWPIAVWSGNYAAFLYIAILHGTVWLIASHLLAKRPFRLALDKALLIRFFSFGWPLLLNGLLIFAVLQGDRIILAKAYSKTELGAYSVALSIAMLVPTMLGGILSQLSLPLLAKLQENRSLFESKLRLLSKVVTLVAALLAVAFIIVGPLLIQIIYGPKYILAGQVIGWLGLMHALRLLRQVPTVASIALGETKNALYSNITRQSGLILAVWVALSGGGLQWIAAAGIVGEVVAILFTISIINRRLNIPMNIWASSLSGFFIVVSLAATVKHFLSSLNNWTIFSVFIILEILIVALWLLLDKQLYHTVKGYLKEIML